MRSEPSVFRELVIEAVKTLGVRSGTGSSPTTIGNWRLFRGPLILSYYPVRNSVMVVSRPTTSPDKKPGTATVIWCGIEDAPVAPFDEAQTIIEGWLEDHYNYLGDKAE